MNLVRFIGLYFYLTKKESKKIKRRLFFFDSTTGAGETTNSRVDKGLGRSDSSGLGKRGEGRTWDAGRIGHSVQPTHLQMHRSVFLYGKNVLTECGILHTLSWLRDLCAYSSFKKNSVWLLSYYYCIIIPMIIRTILFCFCALGTKSGRAVNCRERAVGCSWGGWWRWLAEGAKLSRGRRFRTAELFGRGERTGTG